jgi:hypothetical protein
LDAEGFVTEHGGAWAQCVPLAACSLGGLRETAVNFDPSSGRLFAG